MKIKVKKLRSAEDIRRAMAHLISRVERGEESKDRSQVLVSAYAKLSEHLRAAELEARIEKIEKMLEEQVSAPKQINWFPSATTVAPPTAGTIKLVPKE